MTMSTTFLVIRHGESEWNAQRRWQGQADPPLTDLGRTQAHAAVEKLGTFDLLASSDLQRARTTAEIIGHRLGIELLPADVRLRETHVGEWEGLTVEEIEAAYPGYLARHERPPMFEPDASVISRFTSALADLSATCPGGQVLVVAHAGVVRVMRRALGASDPRIPNLGGCTFTLHHRPNGTDLTVGDIVELVDHGAISEAL